MLRRDMLRYTGAAILSSAMGLNNESTAFADDKPQESTPQPAPPQPGSLSKQDFPFFTKQISLEEIAAEVKKTHRDILEGTGITYLTPVTYDAEVYQRNSAQKSPVLVFFYGTDDEREVCASKRLAVVVKNLALHFGNKLKFCAYDEGKYGGGPTTQRGTKRLLSETATKEGLPGVPSLILYGSEQVTPITQKHSSNREIFVIDRSAGGPPTDKGILIMLRNDANYWIRGNILNLPNPDNDGKIYRYEKKGDLQEVTLGRQ